MEHKDRTANVQVFVRLRPLPGVDQGAGDASRGGVGSKEVSWLSVNKPDSTITATAPPRLTAKSRTVSGSSKSLAQTKASAWTFNVNHVLDQSVRQDDVFAAAGRDMVQQLVQG